jgi:hypothetical protein
MGCQKGSYAAFRVANSNKSGHNMQKTTEVSLRRVQSCMASGNRDGDHLAGDHRRLGLSSGFNMD